MPDFEPHPPQSDDLRLKVVGGEISGFSPNPGGELSASEIVLPLPATIGRGRDVSLSLTHPLVSRHHCELSRVDGYVLVRDLGSLNGTFIGSDRVELAYLKPGELLTIGTVTFRADYTVPEGAADPTPLESMDLESAGSPTRAAPDPRRTVRDLRNESLPVKSSMRDTEPMCPGRPSDHSAPHPDPRAPEGPEQQPPNRNDEPISFRSPLAAPFDGL
jgi:pSer/pThr/pTyr-binding forkhead associated (FHA) protein